MNLRLAAFALVGAAAALGSAAGLAQTSPSGPVPPQPPTPVPVLAPSVTPAPLTSAASNAKRAAAKPAATDTPNSGTRSLPSPPAFANLTGIWEVAIQPGGALTLYSHLLLQQSPDNSIAGYWELQNKKKLPLNGTFDGKQFKFTVTDGKKQETFAGYQDGFADMVGLADMGDGKRPLAFTAAHRAKQKFLNNLQLGVPGAAGGSAPGGGVGPAGGL
jgi:hypothetical protein